MRGRWLPPVPDKYIYVYIYAMCICVIRGILVSVCVLQYITRRHARLLERSRAHARAHRSMWISINKPAPKNNTHKHICSCSEHAHRDRPTTYYTQIEGEQNKLYTYVYVCNNNNKNVCDAYCSCFFLFIGAVSQKWRHREHGRVFSCVRVHGSRGWAWSFL